MDFPNVKSNRQIIFIWNDKKLKHRLTESIKWPIFHNCLDIYQQFYDILDELVKEKKNDNEIYDILREFYLNTILTNENFTKKTTKELTQGKIISKIANGIRFLNVWRIEVW